MNNLSAGMCILSLVVCSGVATAANCEMPEIPVFPDHDTAVLPQMIKAKNDINSYIASIESYLLCAKRGTRKSTIAAERRIKVSKRYNSLVRAFKKRQAG
jgi:hypothetical protein